MRCSAGKKGQKQEDKEIKGQKQEDKEIKEISEENFQEKAQKSLNCTKIPKIKDIEAQEQRFVSRSAGRSPITWPRFPHRAFFIGKSSGTKGGTAAAFVFNCVLTCVFHPPASQFLLQKLVCRLGGKFAFRN